MSTWRVDRCSIRLTYYSQSADSTTRDDRYFKGRGRTVTVGYQVNF